MLDVFNHFTPRSFFNKICDRVPNHAVVRAFPQLPPLLDIEERLQLLDEFDGLQQILSLANPPIEHLGPADTTPDLAREANDMLAEICRKYPDRFPGFIAAMPLNNVDASLREIDRAITQLGACGIQMYTNVSGAPLSAPELRPIFARMVKHDRPVWVHPIRGPQMADYATETASEDEVWFTFGWPYETTACMTRLIYSGIFDEYPTLKIITHHMGGMIPYFAGKINLGFSQIFFGTRTQNPVAQKRGLKRPPMEYFKLLYGDTALNGEIAATRCGHSFFGTDKCLFATDAPFDSEKGRWLIRDTITAVSALDISTADRDKIFRGNARALLNLK
jgi:aminocarboxymuconate-semialdehyde decarboxylase